MAYEVLARKWRPRQFDDVVGQDHVTRTLRNAIESNRIAHAYLLVGPRGIGKTSIARIFAKALNCEIGPTPAPCGECDSCREIVAGNGLDVIEIDGASNNSVDQVRELRENARFMPVRGRFKIYMIDEVHMLSASAFNALLKTLEEPPPRVKFIFATTESHKVLPTIVSRCQRFDLRRIAVREIIGHLAKISAAEGVEVSEDALLAIARGADGGLRDAESALDQLISFCGNSIGEEDVLSVFGLVSRRLLEDLAEAILRGDLAAIVSTVADLDARGKNLSRVLVETIDQYRNVLIARAGAGALDASEGQAQALRRMAEMTDDARLLRIVEILMDSEGRVRNSLSPRTLLETSLLRCARAATTVPVDVLLRRLNECKALLSAGEPAGEPDESRPPRPVEPAPRTPPAETNPVAAPAPAAPAAPPPPMKTGTGAAGGLGAEWPKLIERLGTARPALAAALRATRVVSDEGGRVTLGVDREYAERAKALEQAQHREWLEKAVGRAADRAVTIEVQIVDGPLPPGSPPRRLPADSAAGAPAVEPDAPAPGAPQPPAAEITHKRAARKSLIEDPGVQKILKQFKGRITDIRE